MQTVAQATANDKRDTVRAGRQTHRRATVTNTMPAQRARYVAEAILLRQDEGRTWTWETFGLERKPEQQALVVTALAALQ